MPLNVYITVVPSGIMHDFILFTSLYIFQMSYSKDELFYYKEMKTTELL